MEVYLLRKILVQWEVGAERGDLHLSARRIKVGNRRKSLGVLYMGHFCPFSVQGHVQVQGIHGRFSEGLHNPIKYIVWMLSI